uniref:Uncharacterized protein n=1 Tax=Paramormyrops kingsleyae TaxID=1676925 RepID=A0A3B3RKF3_9TELE
NTTGSYNPVVIRGNAKDKTYTWLQTRLEDLISDYKSRLAIQVSPRRPNATYSITGQSQYTAWLANQIATSVQNITSSNENLIEAVKSQILLALRKALLNQMQLLESDVTCRAYVQDLNECINQVYPNSTTIHSLRVVVKDQVIKWDYFMGYMMLKTSHYIICTCNTIQPFSHNDTKLINIHSLHELWRSEPQRIKFLIQSVCDVLPSSTNLHRWGLADTPACQLRQKRGTLEHILSCCPKALGEGRYRWCHDQVLRALADTVSVAITSNKAGEKAQQQPSSSRGLLSTACDWKLQVDLGRQLKFPEHISATSLCPDMVLTSESTKASGSGRTYCPLGRPD